MRGFGPALAPLLLAIAGETLAAAGGAVRDPGAGPCPAGASRFQEGVVLVALTAPRPAGETLTGLPEVDAVLLANGVTAVRPALRLDWGRDRDLKRRHGLDRILAADLPAGAPVARIAAELTGRPGVAFAEPDAIGCAAAIPPNDTHWPEQWDLDNRGQYLGGTPDADVDAPEAWTLETGSAGVVLSVIDSGVEAAHTELVGRIVAGHDFVNDDADPEGDHPHGTEVAGVALANANNAFGIAGVDWAARQMPVKALGADGLGTTTDLADSVIWAADHGASVVNMSLQHYPCSGSLRSALQYALAAGVVLVSAAGNDGIGGADTSGPGCISETISVGATDWFDRRASFSGTGAALDVVAPGNGVRTIAWHSAGDVFSSFSGTSAAAPIVSGLATLLRAADPTLTTGEVRALIESNADDAVGPAPRDPVGRDNHFGWGRVNLRASLEAVAPGRLRRGQAIPRTVGVGGTATFSAVYTSAAGHPPDFVRLVVDSPTPGIWPMARSTAGAHPVLMDGDFTNGERYEAVVPLGSTGTWRTHVECEELGAPARLPETGASNGPRVTLIVAEALASSETHVASTAVDGDFTDTQVLDGETQTLDEVSSGGAPSQRYSTLEHRWAFTVTPGASVRFLINAGLVAFWPAENDHFAFSYSTNGGTSWVPMLTVQTADPGDTYQSFALPPGTSGSVLVRAEDTDSTPGNTGNDRLFIDHMLIRTEAAATPGEATDLRVTAFDPGSGDMTLSWTPACGATGHVLVSGPLAAVSSYGYTGQICGLGVGGSYAGFDPGPGSVFFLVTGRTAAGVEGSYGTRGSGAERPQQTADPSCATAQDLTHRCDY